MSAINNHLGLQKDVWGIIEQYSKPTLWWYWCRDPSKRHQQHPDWYSNISQEFKVIEASSEEQARYIIYRDVMGVFPIHLGIIIDRKTWDVLQEKYNVYDHNCQSCKTFDHLLESNDTTKYDLTNYCQIHFPTRDVLLDALNISHCTHISYLDDEMKKNVKESIQTLCALKWLEIKKIEW